MAIRKTVIKRYESQAWVDNYPVTAWAYIENIPSTFPPSAHTHNYAGSSSAGGDANNAVKLNGQVASYYLNYNNFTNKPTIPTKTSQLTNDSGYLTSSTLTGDVVIDALGYTPGTSNFTGYTSSNKLSASYISGLATVATSGSYNDLSNKPTIPTKASWNYDDRYVRYDTNSQGLNATQKANARTNIGAGTSNFTGYTDSNRLGTGYISGITEYDTLTEEISAMYSIMATKYVKPSGGIPASDLAQSYYLASNPSGYITGITENMIVGALGYEPGTSNFSGSYNDLSNKPTIPTKVSQLSNDSGYITGITSYMVTAALGYTPLKDVPFPTFSQLITAGYLRSDYESAGYPTDDFCAAICRWAINTYANQGDITLEGSIAPNSSGTCIMHLYSSSGKDSNNNPRYCTAIYNALGGVIDVFGFSDYVWFWKAAAMSNDLNSYLPLSGGNMSGNINFGDNTRRIGAQDSSTLTRWSGATVALPTSNASRGIVILADEGGDFGLLFVGSDGAIIANSGDTGYIFKVYDKDQNSSDFTSSSGLAFAVKQSGGGVYAQGNFEASGDVYATTLYEDGTSLASKYLGISAKAADSSKLNGQAASYYLNYNNFTNTPTIPTKTSQLTNDSGYLTSSTLTGDVVIDALGYTPGTSNFSGSYNDLSNKPTIPTKVSQLTNDSGYITGITSSMVTTALGYTPLSTTGTAADSSKLNGQAASYYLNYNNLSNKPTIYTDCVRYVSQSLTNAQKSQARTNIGAGTSNFTGYTSSNPLSTLYIDYEGDTLYDIIDDLYGLANSKYTKPSGGIPASDLAQSYYLASNPNGYTSNNGTVTSVSVKINGTVKGTVTTSGTIDLGTIGGGGVEIEFVGYLYFNDDRNTPVWFEISAAGYGLSEGLYIVAPEDSYPGFKSDNARYWQGAISRLSATEGSFKLWKTRGDSCGYVQFTYSSPTSVTITSSDCAADYGKFVIYKVMGVDEP